MSERIVKILLRADAAGLVQGMGRAKDATTELGSKVAQSARSQREDWATVGAGLTGVGIAITGVGIAALKTGISYNTLQQTSRAALSSILGSAQAANAQMDKLDAFARNSPFAKQTFIVAQQQMLAFGIEAKNVIPYLDAIQNAVAAAGGSNADIEALAEIFGKISSSSKITAIDLQQFGRRGINAAELIGQSMGKTGAEIREQITAGTLDADAALEALATGMATKFEGASDNVKQTFAGAMDRVKAAWRDFSSELATPLVDPNGGGALVDLLNWTADMMRAFEDLPGPVKTTVSALAGAVGVAALLGGTFMLALPKFLAFGDSLRKIGVNTQALNSKLGTAAKTLGIYAAAWVAVNLAKDAYEASMESGVKSQDELTNALLTSKDSVDLLMAAGDRSSWSEFWHGDGYTDTLDDLGGLFERTGDRANNFWAHANGGTSNKDIAALNSLERLGESFAELASTDLPRATEEFKKLTAEQNLSAEEMQTLMGRMAPFKEELVRQATALGVAADDTNLLKIALGEIAPVTDDAADSVEGFADANDDAANAVEDHIPTLQQIAGVAREVESAFAELAGEIQGFGSTSIDAGRAAIKFEEELLKLETQVSETDGTLDRSTEAGRANESALYDMAEAANKAAGAAYEAGESQETVNAILDRGRDALGRAARAFGATKTEAKEYQDQLMATPENVDTYVKLHGVTEAERLINSLIQSRIVDINIRANMPDLNPGGSGGGRPGLAYGGTVGYASGGTIPGASNGLTIGGLGGGVARGTVFGAGTAKSDSIIVRLSKGEEVTQEPYASQNRGLLKAINRGEFHQGMLQPQVVSVGSSSPKTAVYVQNPFTGEYLLAKVADVAGKRVDKKLGPLSGAGLNMMLGVTNGF